MAKNETTIIPLFATPLMQVQLDLDLEKLTEFAFQMQNKNKKGRERDKKEGGWQSDSIHEEKHEEFIRLKKGINQYLQIYHSEVFRGMEFKGNVTQSIDNIWININEKHHYNEWHIHGFSTLSGIYYIKHDGSIENGDIMFKHPISSYVTIAHWPPNTIKKPNEITSGVSNFTPTLNMLLIFPSWLSHSVESNLKQDSRISLSFNSQFLPEKNNG